MKKYMAVFAALALTAGAASAASAGTASSEKNYTMCRPADSWQGGNPVETGAVPGAAVNSKPSPLDTFYDPFHPELREIDRAPGG